MKILTLPRNPKTCRTGTIGRHLINYYLLRDKVDQDLTEPIEIATKALSERPYQERMDLREQIEHGLRASEETEDYKDARKFRDLLIHFDEKILGLEI